MPGVPATQGVQEAQVGREDPEASVAGMFELEGRRLDVRSALRHDADAAGIDTDVLDEVYLYHLGSLPPHRVSELSLDN